MALMGEQGPAGNSPSMADGLLSSCMAVGMAGVERPDSSFSICGKYIGLREGCFEWFLHKCKKVMLGYPSAKK
jgi:hypothetical protein